MKQIVNFKLPALALLFALALAGGPVAAERGADDQTGQTTEVKQSVVHTVATTETSDNNSETMHQQASALVTQLRKNHKEQGQAQRQKKCETRQQGLNTKFDRIINNSQRIQTHISAVLDKAVKYQQTNNLTIDSTLVANAQAAKATSAGSISALQTAKPAIDCTNPSVADEVATFKTAAQTTRSNLKAYRDSVKAVLKALEAAKAPAEGSNQ
jgi:hypothetical protein